MHEPHSSTKSNYSSSTTVTPSNDPLALSQRPTNTALLRLGMLMALLAPLFSQYVINWALLMILAWCGLLLAWHLKPQWLNAIMLSYGALLSIQIALQSGALPWLLLLAGIVLWQPLRPYFIGYLLMPMMAGGYHLNGDYFAICTLFVLLAILLWGHGGQWQRQLLQTQAIDELTGLADKRYLLQQLVQQVSQSKRSKQPLSLVLVNVDHFAAYRQHYGQAKAEACLQHVAQLLLASSHRQADIVARIGDDDFGLLLPDTNKQGAAHLAKRLMLNVLQAGIAHEGNPQQQNLTLSIATNQWQ